MKKICYICVVLSVLSLFISCETPTSSTTSKAAAVSKQSTTVTSNKAIEETVSTTTGGSTEETQVEEVTGKTNTVDIDVPEKTPECHFDKVKGQSYFGIRTWNEQEAVLLLGEDEDDLCEELADRRLALVFNTDGTKAGFADKDDQVSANNDAKSESYDVTVSGDKITLTRGEDKLVLGIHQEGQFLYILEDKTDSTKPKEVTDAGLDYKYTGLAKDGKESPKEKTKTKDWHPVTPSIPGCPESLKK